MQTELEISTALPDVRHVRRAERRDYPLTLLSTDEPRKVGRCQLTSFTGIVTHTNMLLAATEVSSVTQRPLVDLSNCIEARLNGWIIVTGTATAKFYLEYATLADQTVFASLVPAASGLALNVTSSTVAQVTPWVVIPVAARAPVIIRLMGSGGDGVVDPQTRAIDVQFR